MLPITIKTDNLDIDQVSVGMEVITPLGKRGIVIRKRDATAQYFSDRDDPHDRVYIKYIGKDSGYRQTVILQPELLRAV